MKEYYIIIQGEQVGPLSFEELHHVEIKSDTLVWVDGMKDWTKAELIEELKEIFRKTPPPTPNYSTNQKQEFDVNVKFPKFRNNPKNKIKRKQTRKSSKTKFANEVIYTLRLFKWSLLFGLIVFFILIIGSKILFESYKSLNRKVDNYKEKLEEKHSDKEQDLRNYYILNDRIYKKLRHKKNRLENVIEFLIDANTLSFRNPYRVFSLSDGYIYYIDRFINSYKYYSFKCSSNYIITGFSILGSFFGYIFLRYFYLGILSVLNWFKNNSTI